MSKDARDRSNERRVREIQVGENANVRNPRREECVKNMSKTKRNENRCELARERGESAHRK